MLLIQANSLTIRPYSLNSAGSKQKPTRNLRLISHLIYDFVRVCLLPSNGVQGSCRPAKLRICTKNSEQYNGSLTMVWYSNLGQGCCLFY